MKNIEEIHKSLISFKLPRWKDLLILIFIWIKSFFILTKNSHLFFLRKRVITSNMVNNYVKNSIVKPPIKKHYKRYHLAFLIVVCILKRCYSLAEISKLIEIQNDMEHSDLEKAYDAFSICFEECLHATFADGDDKNLQYNASNWQKQLLYNVVRSIVYKLYAEVDLLDKKGSIL